MKYKILFVDDEAANLRMLERLFRDEYEVIVAESGAEGLELLSHHNVAIIVSDQRMPGMSGIDFLKKSAEMRPQTVRIILTGYTDVSDLVEAVNSRVVYRYITKPWVNTDLVQTVQRGIEHHVAIKRTHLIEQEATRLKQRLDATVEGAVNAVREVIAQKNYNLSEHCKRTANYAVVMGERLGLASEDLRQLRFACLLHEVPNMRLPFDIVFNKSALTADQHRVIRKTFDNGVALVRAVPDLEDAGNTIAYQHEHFDGTGLFDGLDGERIPLASRILAVANALDEILSGRNPSLLCTDEAAADWLRFRAGTEFDPDIIELCLSCNLIESPTVNNLNKPAELARPFTTAVL